MRRSKEEQARLEGMAQALRIAKESGIEGLESDIKMRNITGVPCTVSRKDLDKCVENIKENTVDTITLLTAYVLHYKFGWGKVRLSRFSKEVNYQAECLMENYCTWDDLREVMREECGIEMNIRRNDRGVRI